MWRRKSSRRIDDLCLQITSIYKVWLTLVVNESYEREKQILKILCTLKRASHMMILIYYIICVCVCTADDQKKLLITRIKRLWGGIVNYHWKHNIMYILHTTIYRVIITVVLHPNRYWDVIIVGAVVGQ